MLALTCDMELVPSLRRKIQTKSLAQCPSDAKGVSINLLKITQLMLSMPGPDSVPQCDDDVSESSEFQEMQLSESSSSDNVHFANSARFIK